MRFVEMRGRRDRQKGTFQQPQQAKLSSRDMGIKCAVGVAVCEQLKTLRITKGRRNMKDGDARAQVVEALAKTSADRFVSRRD